MDKNIDPLVNFDLNPDFNAGTKVDPVAEYKLILKTRQADIKAELENLTEMYQSYDSIRLTLASPERMKSWAHRICPDGRLIGEVTDANTLEFDTRLPVPGGLFCQEIFGPVESWVCACENAIAKRPYFEAKTDSAMQIATTPVICSECCVELTESRVRRYRMGYIELVHPVAHIWYAKGRPCYLATILKGINFPAKFAHVPLSDKYSWVTPAHIQELIYFKERDDSYFDKGEKKKLIRVNWLEKSYGMFNISHPKPVVNDSVSDFTKSFTKSSNHSARGYDNFDSSLESKEMPGLNPNMDPDIAFDAYLGQLALRNKGNKEEKEDGDDARELYPANGYGISKEIAFELERESDKGNGLEDPFEFNEDAFNSKLKELAYMESKMPNNHPRSFKNKKRRQEEKVYKGQEEEDDYQAKIQAEIVRTGGRSATELLRMASEPDRFRLGAEVIKAGLEELEQDYDAQIAIDRNRLLGRKYFKTFSDDLKRIRLLESFRATKSKLTWMLLTVIPVLPPTLRPFVALEDGREAISDLNLFYKLIITRNNGLATQMSYFDELNPMLNTPIHALQIAVDQLIDNARTEIPRTLTKKVNEKPLKSLTETLEAKEGRFRDNLLGKRADYSGRSVIVSGPHLQLNECGLPFDMALELFRPILLKKILAEVFPLRKHDFNLARKIIEARPPILWEMLAEILSSKLVLLNRAPTLHRFGVQAFHPVLVLGKAIQLHPLVCNGFNADFDGDQMAVHIPLYEISQLEAASMMLPYFNVLSPANGEVVLKPSQDIVIGCYYLTLMLKDKTRIKPRCFFNVQDVLTALHLKKVEIHTLILMHYSSCNFQVQMKGNKLLFADKFSAISKKDLIIHKIFAADDEKEKYYIISNIGILIAYHKNDRYFITEIMLETTPGRIVFSHHWKNALEFRDQFPDETNYADYSNS